MAKLPTPGILELDLHGLRAEEAKKQIDRAIRRAGPGVYILRLIHGYHRGSALQEMIREEYGGGRNGRVRRIQPGSNPGITELIFREL